MKIYVSALMVLSLLACNRSNAQTSPNATTRTKVTVEAPRTKNIATSLVLPGRLEPFEQSLLRCQIQGQIEAVYVDIGDSFKKGDLLVKVSAPDLDGERDLAAAEIGEAKAEKKARAAAVRLAKVRFERLERVAKSGKGLVSQQKRDEARIALGLARAEQSQSAARLNATRQRLKVLEARVGFTRIKAPYDGVVVEVLLHSGNLAGPNASILEVARVDKVRAVAFVPAREAALIDASTRSTVTFPGVRTPAIQGPLTRVAGALDLKNQELRVEVHLTPPAGVRAGGFIRMKVDMKTRENARVISGKAFHLGPKPGQVFVLRGGVCKVVTVVMGSDDGRDVEIVDGLKSGDKVVIAAAGTLTDGVACWEGK